MAIVILKPLMAIVMLKPQLKHPYPGRAEDGCFACGVSMTGTTSSG